MPSPHFFGQEGIGAERAGVRFAGRDKPVHRIGWGEVQLCRLRRFAERLDRAGQAEDGIPDRNPSAARTLPG